MPENSLPVEAETQETALFRKLGFVLALDRLILNEATSTLSFFSSPVLAAGNYYTSL